jgi:hypothetical protein
MLSVFDSIKLECGYFNLAGDMRNRSLCHAHCCWSCDLHAETAEHLKIMWRRWNNRTGWPLVGRWVVGARRRRQGRPADLFTIWTVPLVCRGCQPVTLVVLPACLMSLCACLLPVGHHCGCSLWAREETKGVRRRIIIMPDRRWSARPATVVPRSGYSCPGVLPSACH